MLRRWKKIAGKTEAIDPKTGRPPPGWLAEEQIDGQRYHTLVSLLDGAAGGERATLDDPERTKDWWTHLPRTAAWADRYGGKFEQVRKLIDDAIEAKRRSRRNRRLVAVLSVVGVLIAGAWIWVAHERAQRRLLAQERLRQEDIDKSAMTSAKTLLEDVLEAYNEQSLDIAGAESLATISGQFLDDTRAARKTSAADLIWAQALNVDADLKATLEISLQKPWLWRGRQKKTHCRSRSPIRMRAEPLQALYDASVRVGNGLAAFGKARSQDALQRVRRGG